ncbi:hypothetical protein J2S17_005207 [Cytobacillus purgationiresistens]|uniref:Uncharacterized protein n=1 Tax=Cytobacillus purgationiresistens TaxID=863449 RepID=A0ABU0ATA8_9BACI|nr:hypothetical protein [Cytobacillus purgationiresistens]
MPTKPADNKKIASAEQTGRSRSFDKGNTVSVSELMLTDCKEET